MSFAVQCSSRPFVGTEMGNIFLLVSGHALVLFQDRKLWEGIGLTLTYLPNEIFFVLQN